MTIEKQPVENFGPRGKSYKEGMLLLIAHLTDQDWKAGGKFLVRVDLIEKNVERIYEDYDKQLHEKASFDDKKKHLDSLLEKYNDILLQHTTLKNSFQSLLLAERCSVWEKGRKPFETSEEFTLAQETPSVDSEILRQEYAKIDSDAPPRWFQHLALWQQDFIKANWEDLSTKSIPSSLRSVPGVANMSRHDFRIDNKKVLTYFRHATPFPIDLLKQADTEEEGIRLTYLNLASQIRLSLEQELNKPDVSKIREAVILTQSLLSPGTAATFKSQHISDSSDNDTKIYEMKEKAVKRFQDVLKTPSEDEKFLAQLAEWGLMVQSDGSVKYKGQSFKITLLSTNHPLNVLRRFGVHPEQTQRNDLNTALLLGAIERYLSPLLTEKIARINVDQPRQIPGVLRHTYSLLKKLNNCAGKESISSDQKEDLIKTLEVILNSEEKTEFDENTLRLLDALQTLLFIPSGQGSLGVLGFLGIGDQHHRQSLMSAMETIIINCLGATLWMACKSGKDRTGGASAACDAAATFYELRKRYPRYEAADRALYLKIYKDLFQSGHHQRIASQNAPGANGLIKSNLFLPDDMTLDAPQVQLETQLARLNKPKPIHKKSHTIFNNRLLENVLKELRGSVEKRAMGDPSTLDDWNRSLKSERYFISGKNIKELRIPNGVEFKDEADLMGFIEEHLLNKIQDNHLKKYYSALFLSAFHQGGFTHVFSRLGYEITNKLRLHSGTVYKQPDFKINLSPLVNGVQIEEINTCTKKSKKVGSDGDLEEVPLEEGRYHYQAHSCTSVTLSPVKNQGYKLETTINHVVVDCDAEELKPLIFKKTGLFGALSEFFVSLIAALKGFFKALVAPESAKERLLDENWLKSLSPTRAKPESATEHVPEPKEALKIGLNRVAQVEADSTAFELTPPQQAASGSSDSVSRERASQQPDLKREASFLVTQGTFKSQIEPKMGDKGLPVSAWSAPPVCRV